MVNASSCLVVKSNNLAFSGPFLQPALLIIQPCTLDSQHGGTKQLKPKFDFCSIYDKKATIVVLFYDFFSGSHTDLQGL